MKAASKSELKIAIIGATGAVGLEIVKVLYKRQYPAPVLFASHRSAGKEIETDFGTLIVQEFTLDRVRGDQYDAIFLAVSGGFSLKFGRELAANYNESEEDGPWVIDNSSAFRLDDSIPLVVPEINGEKEQIEKSKSRLIANPNCTTAIAAMVLWPIHCAYGGIQKCIVSTYQA